MVPLVEQMLKSHKDLPKARTAPDKTAIEKQSAATKLGVGVQTPTHNIDVQGGAYCRIRDSHLLRSDVKARRGIVHRYFVHRCSFPDERSVMSANDERCTVPVEPTWLVETMQMTAGGLRLTACLSWTRGQDAARMA
jgi:hypothetical protein